MTTRDASTVREALRRYHVANGFKGDAKTAETIQVRVFGHVGDLPNPRFQRAVLARHDLHHVLTGYATDLRGEAELGAWEIAAGPRHWLAPPPWAQLPSAPVPALRGIASRAVWMGTGAFVWLNNGAALLLGVLAPLRTIILARARAFARWPCRTRCGQTAPSARPTGPPRSGLPRALIKAFVRGLGCRSLYRDDSQYEALLEMRLEELRARVGIDAR